MNNLQLGAMILMIIVAVPVIVGFCWPTDTELEDVWTAEEGTDITQSLATRQIPIIDQYNGPNNNYWIYEPLYGQLASEPVSVTESPSSIPATNQHSTSHIVSGGLSVDLDDYRDYYRLDITADGTIRIDGAGNYHSISYFPDSATIYGFSGTRIVRTAVTQNTAVYINGGQAATFTTHTQTGEYVDLGAGFQLDSNIPLYWGNGMVNRGVTLWIKIDADTALELQNGQGITIATVEMAGNTIVVNDMVLGTAAAYPYIELKISKDEATAAGIIGADSFTDQTYSYGNVLDLSTDSIPASFETLVIAGANMVYEIKRTTSEIGTSKGIQDAAIIPYGYFPHYSWQVVLSQPAQFGDMIYVAGHTYPVDKGTITVEGETVPIRDMAILSLILDGLQHIYINGIEIAVITPSSNVSINLLGSWYVNVTIYDVTQDTQDRYLWGAPGSFGLDRTGYCMVGIMTSLATALAGGMFGRRSMSKAAIVLLISGMSAAVYYCLL